MRFFTEQSKFMYSNKQNYRKLDLRWLKYSTRTLKMIAFILRSIIKDFKQKVYMQI